jgi:hypothetical protein
MGSVRRIGSVLAAIALLATGALDASARDASKKKSKEEPPKLSGSTIDYEFTAAEAKKAEHAWTGRAFVHAKVPRDAPVPLLVFIHGLNVEKIKFRWIGGGQEGDVRRIVSELIESGAIPPAVVAAPTSTDPKIMVNALTTWPGFDLDVFLERTQRALGGAAKIDRARIVVAGHSGAGCNVKGGISTALRPKKAKVQAGLVIDVCMATDLARDLVKAPKDTHVVVSWQEISWANRPTTDFRNVFKRELKNDPPAAGVLRELDLVQPNAPSPHDAMVALTLKKWLPRFWGPAARPAPP